MPKLRTSTFFRIPFLEQFKQGLFWNLFDSVGSQGLLIIYHLLFRHFFGIPLHGVMGCLLSLLYLLIIIFNGGLDFSLAPFLETITRNRRTMRSALYTVFIPQCLFIGTVGTGLYLLYPYAAQTLPLVKTLSPHLTPLAIGLFALTFMTESVRKTLKYFLQLSFYTRMTALVEVGGITTYIMLISTYFVAHRANIVEESWKLLCIVSCLQLFILAAGCVMLYYSLENEPPEDSPSTLPITRMLRSRIFIWANQCMNQLFSGNFLVPICALYFGIEQASFMKVITSISSWITLIAHKVFGITSNALLAHLKFRSLETQRIAFSYLTALLNRALSFLLIFLIINGKKIALLQITPQATINWSLLYFLLIISSFESLFILYEKWYIIEEKAHYYFLFNGICIGLIYSLINYLRSPIAMLLLIITLRIATFIFLTLFSFYWWHIWPSFKLPLKTIALSLLISGIFYLLF